MIVDMHAHLTEGGVPTIDDSIESVIAHMDHIGCDYVIQSCGRTLGIRYIDYSYVEDSIKLYEMSNGRILNYLVYYPAQAELSLEIIEKYRNHPAFVGIKIHPSDHAIPADDESYRAIWETAKKYDLTMMTHSWALTSNPKQKYAIPYMFEKYIKDYPEVRFVFGHSGGRTSGIKEAIALGAKYKNVYFDLAGDVYNRKLIESIVENTGADRLMIGSDIFWYDLSVPIGMVLGADISEEAKELILGGNAARLFNLKER